MPLSRTAGKKTHVQPARQASKIMSSDKFKGGIPELEGHIFNVVRAKQANIFQTTLEEIIQYVGKKCCCVEDIRTTILVMKKNHDPSAKETKRTGNVSTIGRESNFSSTYLKNKI